MNHRREPESRTKRYAYARGIGWVLALAVSPACTSPDATVNASRESVVISAVTTNASREFGRAVALVRNESSKAVWVSLAATVTSLHGDSVLRLRAVDSLPLWIPPTHAAGRRGVIARFELPPERHVVLDSLLDADTGYSVVVEQSAPRSPISCEHGAVQWSTQVLSLRPAAVTPVSTDWRNRANSPQLVEVTRLLLTGGRFAKVSEGVLPTARAVNSGETVSVLSRIETSPELPHGVEVRAAVEVRHAATRCVERIVSRLVYDTAPPSFSNLRLVVTPAKDILVQVVAVDVHAGVAPHRSRVLISEDDGASWDAARFSGVAGRDDKVLAMETWLRLRTETASFLLQVEVADDVGNLQRTPINAPVGYSSPFGVDRLRYGEHNTWRRQPVSAVFEALDLSYGQRAPITAFSAELASLATAGTSAGVRSKSLSDALRQANAWQGLGVNPFDFSINVQIVPMASSGAERERVYAVRLP